jgi:hypothetical protein
MRARPGSLLFTPVALALCLLFAAPPWALASFVPSSAFAKASADGPAEGAALEALKASLEDDLIASRLAALGVSTGQARARLAALTPAERELVAAGYASIQGGGEAQVFITISTVMPAPLALGLLLLWLMILALGSSAQGW